MIFLIVLKITNKYSTWEEDEPQNENQSQILDTTITFNGIQIDVSKDQKLKEKSQFFSKNGKFYGCLGHDITVCCAKERFTADLMDKSIDDYKLKEKEV